MCTITYYIIAYVYTKVYIWGLLLITRQLAEEVEVRSQRLILSDCNFMRDISISLTEQRFIYSLVKTYLLTNACKSTVGIG